MKSFLKKSQQLYSKLQPIVSTQHRHTFFTIIVILNILLLMLFSYLAGQRSRIPEVDLLQRYVAELRQENRDQLAAFELCKQNRGVPAAGFTEKYDFSTFGVYSPDLDDVVVNASRVEYCGNEVTIKLVNLDDVYLSVFYLEESETYTKSFRSDLIGTVGSTGLKDIPTFKGYENYGLHASFASSYIDDWSASQSFEKQNNMTWYVSVSRYPGNSGVVELQHYSTFSPMGTSMFVTLSKPITYNNEFEYQQVVNQAVAELELVAEEISVRF